MTLSISDFISTQEKEVLNQIKEAFPSVDLYVYERDKRRVKVEVYFDCEEKDPSKEELFYEEMRSMGLVEIPAMGQSLGIIHIILS